MTVPESVEFEVPGKPVSWARAGTNGRRRYTPARQREAMATVRGAALEAFGPGPWWDDPDAPLTIRVTCLFALPKRPTKRWVTHTPDASNLLKLVEDALIGTAYVDDAQIVQATAAKRYADRNATVVHLSPAPVYLEAAT